MGRDHLSDLGIGGRIILKYTLKKEDVRVWTRFIWLRIGSSVSSCEHGNESLGSIKGHGFCLLSDYQLLKKDSAAFSSLVSYLRRL
jgi:hypothetical protein